MINNEKIKTTYLAFLISLCFCSCFDEIDTSSINDGTINESMTIKTTVFGHVRDIQNRLLSGVNVTLMGDKLYETKTDENGYYHFSDVFIGSATALIGIAPTQSNQLSSTGEVALNTAYNLHFSHKGLATFKTEVELSATVFRTSNSYTFESQPFGYEATLVPFAETQIKVLTGLNDGGGIVIPASNALIELRPHSGDANQYETVSVIGSTDGQGVFKLGIDQNLAAVSGYRLIVYPYDINPSANDGFEYDTALFDLDLSPYSIFNHSANPNFNLGELVVNLRDATATNRMPSIAFSIPEENGKISQNSPIRLIFNQPMNPTTIQYGILGCSNEACGEGSSSALLTEEIKRESNELQFRVLDAHTRIFSHFQVHIFAESYDGQELNQVINYQLEDSLRPFTTTSTRPRLFLSSINQSDSANYFFTVDAGQIYVFEQEELDQESYLGALFNSQPNTVAPNFATNELDDSSIELKFTPDPLARGYKIFAKDTHMVTSWIELSDIAPSSLPELDLNTVYTSVNLQSFFDFYNDENLTPFCCGNIVQLAILPYYGESEFSTTVNPMTMATLEADSIMYLSDNYGSAIFPEGEGTSQVTTEFSNLLYNQQATLVFSEYLKPTDELDKETQLEIEGRFSVTDLRWIDDTAHQGWHIQLEPRQFSGNELFIGDFIKVNEDDYCQISKVDLCEASPKVYCDDELFTNENYLLLGPVRGPVNSTGVEVTTNLTPNTTFSTVEKLDDSILPGGQYFLNTGSTYWTLNIDGIERTIRPQNDIDTSNNRLSLINPVDLSVDLTTTEVTISNHVTIRLTQEIEVETVGQSEIVEFKVNRPELLRTGIRVFIDDPDIERAERVRILDINPTTGAIVALVENNHDIDTPIRLHLVDVSSNLIEAGETALPLVGGTANWVDPNGDCSLPPFCYLAEIIDNNQSERVLIVDVIGNSIVFTRDLTGQSLVGLISALPENSRLELLEKSVRIRSVLQSFNQLEGIKADSRIRMTVGQGENQSFSIDNFSFCAVEKVNNSQAIAYMNQTNGLNRLSPIDEVIEIHEQYLRPVDSIKVKSTQDAAGNRMRVEGATILGNGELK